MEPGHEGRDCEGHVVYETQETLDGAPRPTLRTGSRRIKILGKVIKRRRYPGCTAGMG